MGDLFKREVFRPVVTTLVPGVIALTPYAIKLLLTYPGVQLFVNEKAGASVFIAFVFAVSTGLIIEDIGSRIEVRWDARLCKGDAEHNTIWQRYLGITFAAEPVGQRYIRTVLIRFKFELGLAVAIPISWLGFLWLQLTELYWPTVGFLVGSALAAVLFVYALFESCASAKTLSDTRKILVQKYDADGSGRVAV